MFTSSTAPPGSHPVMPNSQKLPRPAQGDIFTCEGRLKVTNAAANVFVVYNGSPPQNTTAPSGLTLDFVMGNVYLIDAVFFFSPFMADHARSGNLVKGLGLQAEGCRWGDTSIETVYDDVVCVVANQPGADCTIGTVAGNVVTVCDMSNPQEHSLPDNVSISTVVGFQLKEPTTISGGGLRRALSAWGSLTFPTNWSTLLPPKPPSTDLTKSFGYNKLLPVLPIPSQNKKKPNKGSKAAKGSKNAKASPGTKGSKVSKEPKNSKGSMGPKRKKAKGLGPLATGANCIPVQRRLPVRPAWPGLPGDGISAIQLGIKQEPTD